MVIELEEKFKEIEPNVKLQVNLGSSGMMMSSLLPFLTWISQIQ